MVGLALELGAMLVAAKAEMEKNAHGRQYPLNEIVEAVAEEYQIPVVRLLSDANKDERAKEARLMAIRISLENGEMASKRAAEIAKFYQADESLIRRMRDNPCVWLVLKRPGPENRYQNIMRKLEQESLSEKAG